MQKLTKKDLKIAFQLGRLLGYEIMNYNLTPKRKRDIIKHAGYCNLLYKQFDQLKEKCQ